jgi:hypothetical protein
MREHGGAAGSCHACRHSGKRKGELVMLVSTRCTATALRGGIKHVYHPSCLSEMCSAQLVRPAISRAAARCLPAIRQLPRGLAPAPLLRPRLTPLFRRAQASGECPACARVCCGHGGTPLCKAGLRHAKTAATNNAKAAAADAAAAAAAAPTWLDAAPRTKKRGTAATEDAKTPKARALQRLRTQ